MIEDGVDVERTVDDARVEAVDAAAQTLTLSVPGFSVSTYKIGPGVLNWGRIESGDRVRATIAQSVTVYVPPGLRHRSPDARVLAVDASYRLLTVQYPNGGTETFKTGLHTRMNGIEAGDSIVIRPIEVIEIHVRGRRRASLRLNPSAASAH